MVTKHEIPVHLNTCVDLALIQKINPDHLIIAQGAAPLIPPIDGTDDPCVRSSWEVLKDNPCLGKRVAVIGGGAVGLETALFAAKKGTLSPEMLQFLVTYEALEMDRIRHYMFKGASRVTLFEMLEKAGQDVGKSTRWILMNNLTRYGVNIKTASKVVSIKAGQVNYEREGELSEEPFDTVILASGSRPVHTLEEKVKALDIPYSVIGDCVKPGKINDAVHGGFLAAISL